MCNVCEGDGQWYEMTKCFLNAAFTFFMYALNPTDKGTTAKAKVLAWLLWLLWRLSQATEDADLLDVYEAVEDIDGYTIFGRS
jgi:hypothetical protein